MKIGELALAAQTQVETIRYYEREGLLQQAPRTEGNYRIYGSAQLERLGFIRHCRTLDMTLGEIRLLLRFKDAPQADCSEVNLLLDEHIGHVATRIRELRQLEKQLKALREQCAEAQDAAHCGILNNITRAGKAANSGKRGQAEHVHGSHGPAPRRAAGARRKAP
jgi:Cd(II)/Pb(II)-responsive transcriptional regulator